MRQRKGSSQPLPPHLTPLTRLHSNAGSEDGVSRGQRRNAKASDIEVTEAKMVITRGSPSRLEEFARGESGGKIPRRQEVADEKFTYYQYTVARSSQSVNVVRKRRADTNRVDTRGNESKV